MKRPMWLISTFAAVFVTACVQIETKTLSDDRVPNGYACTSSFACESGQCLLLEGNAQRKAGICTTTCRTDAQCVSDERCYISTSGGFCLKTCGQGATCADGFVCTGHEPSLCFVEPSHDGGTSCASAVYGSCQNAARTECVEKAGASDADRTRDETACRATSGSIWSDGPCPLLDLVAGCRQGCSPGNQVTWYYKSGPYASVGDVEALCRAAGLTAVSAP